MSMDGSSGGMHAKEIQLFAAIDQLSHQLIFLQANYCASTFEDKPKDKPVEANPIAEEAGRVTQGGMKRGKIQGAISL